MSKYELSLAPDYVSHWTIFDAIRELFQNAIDQETTVEGNTMFHNYNPETQELQIGNKLSILEPKSLLLGATTKGDDEDTIGKFGEGYKIAMLVLLRNTKGVVFYNYGKREIWRPRMVNSRRYGTQVLTVFTEKVKVWNKVPDNNLTIVVTGITPEEYEVVVTRTLPLQKDLEVMETKYGKVLLDEEYKGSVFVNGLFICSEPDLEYGYDFKPSYITIDRDRCMVRGFDVDWLASQMWGEQKDTTKAVAMIKEGRRDVSYVRTNGHTPLISSVYAAFVGQYGEKAIPIVSEHDKQQALEEYPDARPVIVPDTYKDVVEKSDDYIAKLQTLKGPSVLDRLEAWKVTVEDKLSEQDILNFEVIMDMLNRAHR